ncbi:unnamed protein product [Cunninghamella blakesleeana]
MIIKLMPFSKYNILEVLKKDQLHDSLENEEKMNKDDKYNDDLPLDGNNNNTHDESEMPEATDESNTRSINSAYIIIKKCSSIENSKSNSEKQFFDLWCQLFSFRLYSSCI